MKVVIDEEARSDLDRIHAWIAKDSPAIADTVIERILDATELLGRAPRIGHRGRAHDTFEWVVHGLPYIIVYEIMRRGGELIITGIFHDAREHRRI